METIKSNNSNKVIGTIAITISLIAFFYKGMLGGSAGWETLLPIVIVGLVLTVITFAKKRNTVAWIAIGTTALSIVIFFLG